MKTYLRGKNGEVEINTDGPVIIIGESINPTRRKKLVETLSKNDFEFVHELARTQIEAGADVLDVNVGYPGVDDERLLPETVKSIQENFNVPICLDSPNPKAIEAALKVAAGKCLINSINGEKKNLEVLVPIAREYGAAFIGLPMDDDGITHDPEKRLSIAEKILERALKQGMDPEDVIIDPMVMAVSADPNAALVTLETIKLVREKLGLNMTEGTSNVSFGLPNRGAINDAFIALSILNGVTCPIANPVKITSSIRAADLLLGRDELAMRFIECSQR